MVPCRKKGDNAVRQLEHSSGHPNWEGQGPISSGLPAGTGLSASKMGESGQYAAHQRCRQIRYLMRGINGEKLGLKCLNVGKILTI